MTTPAYKYPVSLGPNWTQAITMEQIPSASTTITIGESLQLASQGQTLPVSTLGAYPDYLSSAETLSVVSDNIADTGGGSGAQTLIVFGLDNDWKAIVELVNLNGTTPVTTTKAFLRINNMYVTQSGSAGQNVGTITCTSTVLGYVVGTINPTHNTMYWGQYSVPANKSAYLESYILSTGRADEVGVFFELRENTIGNTFIRGPLLQIHDTTVSVEHTPYLFHEKTDIRLSLESFTNNPRVAASFLTTLTSANAI